jgi:hypothetical protein
MSSPAFEAFVVDVLLDPVRREQFLAHPRSTALAAGLTEEEAAALESIDRVGLRLAAESLRRKRKQRNTQSSWVRRFMGS